MGPLSHSRVSSTLHTRSLNIDKEILCFWSIFSDFLGTSRGFAFVEFNTQEEATRWMEFKQVSHEEHVINITYTSTHTHHAPYYTPTHTHTPHTPQTREFPVR